jgi:hypothetical protein
MKKFITVAAALGAAFGASSAANAATVVFDFADFGNSVFRYGFGTTGFTFTQFSTIHADGCRGVTGFACATSADPFDFPLIGVNTTSSTLNFENTVSLPTNTLFFHPDNGGTDAILAFIAPTTGAYQFSGTFSRIDTNPGGGDGVITVQAATGIYGGGLSPIFATPIPTGPYGSGFSFNNRLTLNAGQAVFFGVNSNGNYFHDSTGLAGTISAVPEPATWAMMIGGFGMVGGAMRYRRRSAKVSYATA